RSWHVRPGITGRVRIESGDFFKQLPSGADAIIMKHIVHDWDDDSATWILQTCHRALGPRGKVLIVDPVVPPSSAALWQVPRTGGAGAYAAWGRGGRKLSLQSYCAVPASGVARRRD